MLKEHLDTIKYTKLQLPYHYNNLYTWFPDPNAYVHVCRTFLYVTFQPDIVRRSPCTCIYNYKGLAFFKVSQNNELRYMYDVVIEVNLVIVMACYVMCEQGLKQVFYI